MGFSELLNQYIDEAGCTAKELSAATGISDAEISRYRSGQRAPKADGPQIRLLARVLARDGLRAEQIEREFIDALTQDEIDPEVFRLNLNTLITMLNLNVARMARAIGYDASYISKIRSGQRTPQDLETFATYICQHVAKNYQGSELGELLHCDEADEEVVARRLRQWLTQHDVETAADTTGSFLQKLDDFDLEEYLEAVHFHQIKVPTLPKGLPRTKIYYGLDGFKTAQLDMLRATAFSSARDEVFFSSNMPMAAAGKDADFTKKFMVGLALILKKGLRLKMVHNLDRPLPELMMGLEGWIPLYMTGQIAPYYFKNPSSGNYARLLCVSGAAVLEGSCLAGRLNCARMYLTNRRAEIAHYREDVELLMKRTAPLMKIYREGEPELAEILRKFEAEGELVDGLPFKNITVQIITGEEVLITKTNAPMTYFVIHHPKLVAAIENYQPVLELR